MWNKQCNYSISGLQYTQKAFSLERQIYSPLTYNTVFSNSLHTCLYNEICVPVEFLKTKVKNHQVWDMLCLSHERFNSPEEGGITNIGSIYQNPVERRVKKLCSAERTGVTFPVSPTCLCLCVYVFLCFSLFFFSLCFSSVSLYSCSSLSHPGQAS